MNEMRFNIRKDKIFRSLSFTEAGQKGGEGKEERKRERREDD